MSTNMKELLEAGVHFGHQTQRWNPKMDNYIYGDKSGIHILDLRITYDAIAKAEDFVQKIVANGGKVLFVGTKPQAQNVIQEQAESAGMPFVNHRWLGGMLTNFKTIIKRVIYLKELISLEDSGEINAYPKPERLRIRREVTKLTRSIGGIVNLSKIPDAKYMVLEARVTDGQEPTTDESLKILRAADILFDTSRGSGVPVKGPNSESLNYLLENLGLDKLAFGTETPFVDYCSPFLRLGAFNTIDEKTKQMIWSGNARRMLNL